MIECALHGQQWTLVVWLYATTGWLGDWLSTVWPDEAFVENNPLVVRYFGERPDPLAFGVAKLGALAVFVVLTWVLDVLIRLEATIPHSVFGLDAALLLPAFVGTVGWIAVVHNCRVRWES